MKIMVFTEGTTIEYPEPKPLSRAVEKLQAWSRKGADIVYLTSHTKPEEVHEIEATLRQFNFPKCDLFHRQEGQQYRDIAEKVMPDILVEDDCQTIGGEIEMTYTHIHPEYKKRIKSVVVRDGFGIDHLPDDPNELAQVENTPIS